MQPDYSKYSLSELRDAYAHIDKEKYPERAALLRTQLREKEREYASTQTELDSGSQFFLDQPSKWFYRGFAVYHLFLAVWGLVSIAALLNRIGEFSLVGLPLIITSIVSLVTGILWLIRSKIAIVLSLLIQLSQLVSINIFSYTYSFKTIFWIFITIKQGLTVSLDIEAGLMEYELRRSTVEEPWLFGINLVALVIVGLLGELYKKYEKNSDDD